MYFFVRFSGFALLVFGLFFLLFGFGSAVGGFFFSDLIAGPINNFLFGNSGSLLPQDAIRLYTSAFGLAVFLLGMTTAALGQLMLVFVDLAVNTRETNIILRSLRRRDI